MRLERTGFSDVWLDLLTQLYRVPSNVFARGHSCAEIRNVNVVVYEGLDNLLVHPVRNLSYRFAVAEWLWIWFGREDVATISQYNKHIAEFSDNGVDFNGSYGPPVKSQWPHVLETLRRDPFSRQAVIQIYRPPTGPTKDVPCTLSVQFLIRDDALHVIVNMRSSDIWLGLPYDFFNFSMFGNILAGQLGLSRMGSVSFNLGSSHLYSANYDGARDVLDRIGELGCITSPRLPGDPPSWLEHVLVHRASLGHNDRAWGRYVSVLLARTNQQALEAL